MSDFWDNVSGAAANPTPSPKSAQPQTQPQPASGDFWSNVASAAKQPGAPQAPPDSGHGALYNLADKALNYSNINSPEYQSVRPSGIAGDVLDASVKGAEAPVDLIRGMAKGVLSSSSGIGSIINRFSGSSQPFNQGNLKALTTANGAAQDVGKVAEQVGEFFTPAPELKGSSMAAKIGLDAAKSGLLSAAQSGGDPLATAAGIVVPSVLSAPVLKVAGNLVSEGLGLSSGAGSAAIKRAFSNPDSSDLLKAIKGDIGPDDIVQNIQDSVTKFRDDASAKYSQELDSKVKNSNISDWDKKAQDFMTDVSNKVNQRLGDFGVIKQTDPDGNIVLNMRHVPSEAGLKEGLQSISDMVGEWGHEPRDLTPSGLDTLKKNLSPYIEQGGRMGAFAKSVYDTAKNKLNDIIPGYSDMTKDYADSSNILKEIKSALGVKPDGSTNTHAAVSKIQYMLKQPTNYREIITNKLPNGQQILDQVAGLHLHDVAPRGLIGRLLLGGEGASALMHPASMPAVAAGAAASSPRLVGESARIAAKASPLLQKFAPKAISSGIANTLQSQP